MTSGSMTAPFGSWASPFRVERFDRVVFLGESPRRGSA